MEEVGGWVADFRIGDEVYGRLWDWRLQDQQSRAEFAAVDAKPDCEEAEEFDDEVWRCCRSSPRGGADRANRS